LIGNSIRNKDHGFLIGLADDDHPQYFRADGSRVLAGPLVQSDINGIDIGNNIAEDIDLITVDEGSADANKPRIWWDEATDSFEMNKSLTLPGGSLKVGTFILSEDPVDSDGLMKIGSLHVHPNSGVSGNICLHEGTEPSISGHGDGHRLWVDEDHNLMWQNESGVSKTIGAAFTEADPIFASWDRSTGISIVESQISDLQPYLLSESDPVFSAWDKSTGIIITESQISDLSHIPPFDGDIPEIFNSAGLLKIQPDVQGDVELFGDTDVGNGENGKIFKIWRRAAEGNDYIRMYMSAGRTGFIHTDRPLTLQSQVPFTINSVTDDIFFKVGDNAGAKKVYFRDSNNNNIATIDSNGNSYFAGNMGIGISPTQLLHVEKNYEGVLISRFYNSNANGISQYLVGASGGGHINLISNSGPGSHIGIPVNGAGIAVDYGGVMVLSVGDSGSANEIARLTAGGFSVSSGDLIVGTNKFVVDVSGSKVGIGLVSPDEKLHILNGSARLESSSGDIAIYFTDNDDDNTIAILYDKSEEVLSIAPGMNGDRTPSFLDALMTFTRSFRVGIKRSDPSCELDVNGNTLLDGTLDVTGDTLLGYLEVTGNTLLDGDLTVSGIIAPLQFASASGVKLNLYGSTYAIGVESSELRIASNGAITFRTDGYDGSVDVAISDSGYLGIGTDSPAEELHILSGSPTIIFEESDGSSNEKCWELVANSNEFKLQTVNDLYSGSSTIFKARDRGGTSVGTFAIPNADVIIGADAAPATSAVLELRSTSGALLLPRMSTTQRNNLTGVNGMMIYDTTQNAFRVYQAGAWKSI